MDRGSRRGIGRGRRGGGSSLANCGRRDAAREGRTYRRTCSWSSRAAWRWRECEPSSSPSAVCVENALSRRCHCRRTSGRRRGRAAPSCSCSRQKQGSRSSLVSTQPSSENRKISGKSADVMRSPHTHTGRHTGDFWKRNRHSSGSFTTRLPSREN